jgi:hypothetical protein
MQKTFKKRQPSIPEEVGTQDWPGSDFMTPRREDCDDIRFSRKYLNIYHIWKKAK